MENKVITLISSDGQIFPVEEAVIAELRGIHRLLSASGGAYIPISEITGDILAKIIDYCRKHNDYMCKRLLDLEICEWDRAFFDVDDKTLVDLFIGSNILEVKDLFDLTMVKVVEMMKKKGPSSQLANIEQLRNLFMFNFSL